MAPEANHSIPARNPWFRLDANTPAFPAPLLTNRTSDSSNEPNTSSSSVSSPSTDYDEVEALLNGINHVRRNDLWTTPPPSISKPLSSTPRARPAPSLSTPLTELPAAPGSDAYAPTTPVPSLGGGARAPPCAGPGEPQQSALADPARDFPALFKVYPCPTAATCYAAGLQAECFYYHSLGGDRRRACVARYRPYMCRFVGEAGGCWKGDRCPFAHNDFERRYHPDRFGKETCRDFLRDACPRRYCTFRHEVAPPVAAAAAAIAAMADKELLQLVLRVDDRPGRALSEKLARRFGFGRRHVGWRLAGFAAAPAPGSGGGGAAAAHDPALARAAAAVRDRLRARGERKWAAILKTGALRDMMSAVRKVTEEIRERLARGGGGGDAGGEGGGGGGAGLAPDAQRLIRTVFSNANWSCHSHEGDNPFVVTPANQADAVAALACLVDHIVPAAAPGSLPVPDPHGPAPCSAAGGGGGGGTAQSGFAAVPPVRAFPPLYGAGGPAQGFALDRGAQQMGAGACAWGTH